MAPLRFHFHFYEHEGGKLLSATVRCLKKEKRMKQCMFAGAGGVRGWGGSKAGITGMPGMRCT